MTSLCDGAALAGGDALGGHTLATSSDDATAGAEANGHEKDNVPTAASAADTHNMRLRLMWE
jgi:hypothetical protein